MQMTRYFAVGVEQAPDGEFVAGKCDEVPGAPLAIRKARSLAHQTGGAVAFEWRGDVEFGRPGSIEILAASASCPLHKGAAHERIVRELVSELGVSRRRMVDCPTLPPSLIDLYLNATR